MNRWIMLGFILLLLPLSDVRAEEMPEDGYLNPAQYTTIEEADEQFIEVFGEPAEALKEVEVADGQEMQAALFKLGSDVYISLQAFQVKEDMDQAVIYYGFLSDHKESLQKELEHLYPEQGEAILKSSVEKPYKWKDLLFIYEEIDQEDQLSYFVTVYNQEQYETMIHKLSYESR